MKKSGFVELIIFTAIIGFSMAGCENDPDPDHEHQWSAWDITTTATCIATGSQTRTCVLDATHTETEVIPIDLVNGHDYEWIVTTHPTTTAEGIETETCKNNPLHINNTRTISKIFTSTTELNTYLATLPNNDTSTPYRLALNVNNLNDVKTVLNNNSVKYINLNLSGSTFTYIDFQDFYNCTSLINITIPEIVTSIEDRAFSECFNLVSINIPANITSIHEQAFTGCYSLTTIDVTSDNTAYSLIDEIVYSKDGNILILCPGGKRGIVNIPNSVTSIGNYAFNSCINLTSITIPNNIISIGEYAFYRCGGLNNIIIPNSIKSIEEYTFSLCQFTSITIPDSVTYIGRGAFWDCSRLTSVTFEGNVSNFGEYSVFFGNLVSVYDGPGTYTTTANSFDSAVWTKQ